MGTALERSESQQDLALKASSYSMPAWTVDGMDVTAVETAARSAALAIRSGGGPCFLELRTYRFRAHSMYDPERYRNKEEVERWRDRDPLELLAARISAAGGPRDPVGDLEAAVAAEIDDAVAFAEASPPEPEDLLTRYVVTETTTPDGARP
jgi:pyruvate dehydrogenase E1 component alpha subunit